MIIIYTQAPDGNDYRLIGRAKTIAGARSVLRDERRLNPHGVDTYCYGIRVEDETGATVRIEEELIQWHIIGHP